MGIFLVVGILCYNYFLGTPEEKESSRKIFSEIKDGGRSVGNLLKQEKAKLDDGKYDDALQKIGNVFNNIREKAKDSGDLMDRLKNLEDKKDELTDRLKENATEGKEATEAETKDMLEELDRLTEQTKDLVRDMEQEE